VLVRTQPCTLHTVPYNIILAHVLTLRPNAVQGLRRSWLLTLSSFSAVNI